MPYGPPLYFFSQATERRWEKKWLTTTTTYYDYYNYYYYCCYYFFYYHYQLLTTYYSHYLGDIVVLRLWQSLHFPLVVVAFARCGCTLFECGVLRAFDGEGPSQHGSAGWVCLRQARLGLGVRRRLSWS